MTFNIRIAEEKDLPFVQELYKAQLKFHNQLFDLWNEEFVHSDAFYQQLSNFITLSDRLLIVVEEASKIVGYLTATINNPLLENQSKVARLESMHVSDVLRGKGMGRKLIDYFLNWCREKQVTQTIVKVMHNNDETIKFYKRNGYQDFKIELAMDL